MLPNSSLNLITKNIKETQPSKKKWIQYFKDKIGYMGVLFLPETHSNSKVKQKQKENLKGQMFCDIK